MTTLPEAIEVAKSEMEELTNCLRRTVGKIAAGASFADLEATALAVTNEAVRQVLQAELKAIADRLEPRVRVDGDPYAQHEEGTVPYHSLCGSLAVKRWTYREVGV